MLYSAGFLHSFWWLSNTALIGYTTFFYFISWWICHWLFEETRPIVLQIVLHAGSLLPPNAGSLVAPSCFSHRLERNPHSRKLGCQIVCGRTTWRSCLRCRNLGPISRESDLVDLRGGPGICIFNAPGDSAEGITRTYSEKLCWVSFDLDFNGTWCSTGKP